ncbi:MAG: hypothetical protein AAB705_02585 [Patescibacteria group bacterium]
MITTLIKKNIYIFILIIIVFILAIVNYKTGSFLSGWDTLHPEFDFGLNFKRLFFGVWRGEQGLGAPAGHAHMADLPRVIILWLSHFIFPLSILRYLYIFACLLIGPLGIYFLIQYLFKEKSHQYFKLIAFLSSLFYLLNLSTVQQFYVPFEMFTTQYAFVPWAMLYSLRFLKEERKKDLLIFAVITILGTPQAYAPHLWYAFFGTYVLFLLIYFFFKRNKFTFKKILLLIFTTLAINSFWLLPNLYYIKNAGFVPSQSKQNRLYSQEFNLRNKKNGVLSDVALIKGFYFDWGIYDFQKQKSVNLMNEWNLYFNQSNALSIGYGLFIFVGLGIILSLIKKDVAFISLIPFFVVPFIFLMNNAFPFNLLYDFLIRFSLFKEGFRFIFTKFSIILVFSYVVYFSLALDHLFKFSKRYFIIIYSLVIIFALFSYVKPIFTGNLISKKMLLNIPQEYFSFWDYMKGQKNERVLTLPLHSFAGWQYNNWNYQGAGFIWFGLKQPVLNRDFDRWYPYNEQAYRELSFALYSRNADLFAKTLQKYKIGFILLDESIIDTDVKNSRQITFNREAKDLLQKIPSAKLDWQSDFLTLYKTTNEHQEMELAVNLPNIAPPYRFTSLDEAYNNFGDYISISENADIYYPFRTFLNETDKLSSNITFNLEDFYFQADMGVVPKGKQIIPILKSEDNFASQGGSINFSLTSVYGKIPKQGFTIKPTDMEKIPLEQEINWKKETSVEKIHYESKDKIVNSTYDLGSLNQDLAYAVSFRARNISGLPLRLCIKSLYSKRCEIYDELSKNKDWIEDIFVLPPTHQGLGYKLEISNISFGSISTINELSSIKIVPFPYSFLKGIRIEKPGFNNKIEQKIPLNFTDFGFVKIINLPSNIPDGSTIVFNQAFEKNWKAYYIKETNFLTKYFSFIFGQEIKEHVLVNNWANGWKVEGGLVTIIFWPQYLEFLGFGLLILAFVLILL